MSLAGCHINPIDVNFHLQKSLEISDKNSAVKIWSKNDKEIKVSPFMPIRVKEWKWVAAREAEISSFVLSHIKFQIMNGQIYNFPFDVLKWFLEVFLSKTSVPKFFKCACVTSEPDLPSSHTAMMLEITGCSIS